MIADETRKNRRAALSSEHQELLGDHGTKPYRRERINTADFALPLTCAFSVDADSHGPWSVLDLSSRGLSFEAIGGTTFAHGAALGELTIQHGTDAVWKGRGAVTYQRGSRVGVRFTDGFLDLDVFRVRLLVRGGELASSLATWREEDKSLSPEWRSLVSQLGNLLVIARDRLEYLGQNELFGVPANDSLEKEALYALYDEWGPVWEESIRTAYDLSRSFDERALEVARRYSERILVPLFYGSPPLRRAIDKPSGYAGDYHQIIYFNEDDYRGPSLYDRFCHHLLRMSPLTFSCRARQRALTTAIHAVAKQDRPTRVVALACGPVFEIRAFIEETENLHHPMELVLFDQDENALKYAQRELDRLLAERPELSLKVTCIHAAVKQLLKPESEEQAAFLRSALGDADLVYATGLFDYLPDPIAVAFISCIYGMLRPGGGLLIGNFQDAPVSSWPLEFALAWFLIYRDSSAMERLAAAVVGRAKSVEVVPDDTGLCLFLKVRAPG